MKSIELLLREHVPGLGRVGDIVKVAPGFARNYLLPYRLGIEATEDNKKVMARRRTKIDAEVALKAKEFEKVISALASLELKTVERADDQGRLYGSVNAARVAELLASAGHKTDEKSIRIDAPLKAVGDHSVHVHLHGELYAEVTVKIEAEATEEGASA